jgi:hypothetical protein
MENDCGFRIDRVLFLRQEVENARHEMKRAKCVPRAWIEAVGRNSLQAKAFITIPSS